MKYYGKAKIATLNVSVDGLETFLILLRSKNIHDVERALRSVNPSIKQAFELFSIPELEEAVFEGRNGTAGFAVLESSTFDSADVEAKAPKSTDPVPPPVKYVPGIGNAWVPGEVYLAGQPWREPVVAAKGPDGKPVKIVHPAGTRNIAGTPNPPAAKVDLVYPAGTPLPGGKIAPQPPPPSKTVPVPAPRVA